MSQEIACCTIGASKVKSVRNRQVFEKLGLLAMQSVVTVLVYRGLGVCAIIWSVSHADQPQQN